MRLHKQKKETVNIHRGPLRCRLQEHHADTKQSVHTLDGAPERPKSSHLRLPLLQERLQPLLSRTSLVVIAHDQDDVIPAELAHHVEPHLGLVGVRRDRAQE